MCRLTLLVLASLLGSGCLSDRVVTLKPSPAASTAVSPGAARPVTVMPFADRRGAIAEGGPTGGTDAVGGLYGLRGWPAAMRVSEPYPVTLQHALVEALAARGIAATPGGAGPSSDDAYVLSGTIVDFYGVLNWGAEATLRAHVRLSGPDGAYLADKTISREVKQFGLDTVTPKLEDVLARVMTEWVEAVASDPQLAGHLFAP
jgi:hypothetical protein